MLIDILFYCLIVAVTWGHLQYEGKCDCNAGLQGKPFIYIIAKEAGLHVMNQTWNHFVLGHENNTLPTATLKELLY